MTVRDRDPAADDPYACLVPLVAATGSPLAPPAFHQRVNLAFHAAEAGSYDDLHRDLWQSLPAVFERLAADVIAAGAPEQLRLLDIGCGTGLATDLLLRSPLGPRVMSIDVLDTAPEMLAQSAARAKGWPITPRFHEGTLDALPTTDDSAPGETTFDLVLTCSVLHHIPDLADFGRQLARRQVAGGFFVHLQDPNGDALGDPVLTERLAEAATAIERRRAGKRLRRFLPHRVAARAWRELTRTQPKGYLHEVNETLIADGTITRPMAAEEIWSVTDIHVDGLPFAQGRGISVARLHGLLPAYELVAHRSYAFFGALASDLPTPLAKRETALANRNDRRGRQLAAVWRRRPEGD